MIIKQHEFSPNRSAQRKTVDVKRLELLLSNLEPIGLRDRETEWLFVGSLFTASGGNAAVLPIMLNCFRDWSQYYDEEALRDLEALWHSFNFEQPIEGALSILKIFSINQPVRLDQEYVTAIFDPSSDFESTYRAWKRDDPIPLDRLRHTRQDDDSAYAVGANEGTVE